jgi:hypothetical protein
MALRFCFPLLVVLLPACPVLAQDGPPDHSKVEIASSHELRFGPHVLQVDFAAGDLDLPAKAILAHVQAAASAVATYYGGFPVARARLLLVPVAGQSGIMQGTTWPGMNGFEGFTRIRIGQHTTTAELGEDWTTTHELVHMAFPTLPDDQHWMEEGLATYVEPIARVATGELEARQVWRDMVYGMRKGEPSDGDLGLDRTHTWGRTYWGGALFCLVADVTIRRETQNHKGLQDALRAIVAQGGTINHEWPLDQALAIGDRATGTHVLARMYGEWKDKPVPVDLMKLWGELGIHWTAGGPIEFVASAPLARIRESIAGERAQAQPAAVSVTR